MPGSHLTVLCIFHRASRSPMRHQNAKNIGDFAVTTAKYARLPLTSKLDALCAA